LYKIPANTLFIGKNLIFVPECHSTNDLAIEKSHEPGVPEGTVIVTDNQTAGRGQRGNTWKASPGMNLTFSVILKPTFLDLKDQFYLNIITALAVRDLLQTRTEADVKVKWPNDVLVDGKKICGVLIENQLKGNRFTNTVIGIGLNINQQVFDLSAATSLSLVTGKAYVLSEILEQLLSRLEARYLDLVHGNVQKLISHYHEALYWRNNTHQFSSRGEVFNGIIRGVDNTGRLQMEIDGEVRLFVEKEIVYLA